MRKVRVLTAPEQPGVRVVVLGAVLWPDHTSLRAVVESDAEEIEDPTWESDQVDMFCLGDDLGTEYRRAGAHGYGNDDIHVQEWHMDFYPPVPEGAKVLRVSHIAGSVDLPIPARSS
jgi:hypothetical protein